MSLRMNDFINNINGVQTVKPQQTAPKTSSAPVTASTSSNDLRDEFVTQHKKNGLFERVYNAFKNVTHFGIGSKKVESTIQDYENGKVDKKVAEKTISDYRVSQENSAQVFGDVASSGAGLGSFFLLKNLAETFNGSFKLDAISENLKTVMGKSTMENLKNLVGSKGKVTAIAAGVAALTAGFTKLAVLKLDRIGSKEFSVSDEEKSLKEQLKQKKVENAPKAEIRQLKKEIKHLERDRVEANKSQDKKNFFTGVLNGVLAPIVTLGGGLIGGPLYALAGIGTRYAASSNDDNKKSVGDFVNTLKNNGVMTAIGTATIGAVAIKKGKFNETLVKNVEKTVKDLKGVNLVESEYATTMTSYQQLEEILLNSSAIRDIRYGSGSLEDKIRKLTDENIFAVKFLQIKGNGEPLVKALKENCPPSRTMEQAQAEVNKLIGEDGKYTISKLLGVGTIAESYLAKDASGKEVCIKILKDGITAEKIKKDEKTFIELITQGLPEEKLTEEQKYLVRNVRNLADGISKEVDFENEMKAAQKLAATTKMANVVKPIEAKSGIYVMEKANGISVETFAKYHELQSEKKWASSYRIEEIDKEIEKIRSKSPNFDDFDLSDDEVKAVLMKYMDVMVEQFHKVDKNGKTLHADIHPGNIFIDLGALKTKKGKIFTLIDTGNTVDLSREQSLRSLQLTSFIKKANTKDISKFVTDGAVLPEGMTKEQAEQLVEKELNKIFFDTETKLPSMDNDAVVKISSNIMRKFNIMPNDTQLNLNKAKTSANNSFQNLMNSFLHKKTSENMGIGDVPGILKDFGAIGAKYKAAPKKQELFNLLQLPPTEAIHQLFNPNMKQTNSVEYLRYMYKQNMPTAKPEQCMPEMF